MVYRLGVWWSHVECERAQHAVASLVDHICQPEISVHQRWSCTVRRISALAKVSALNEIITIGRVNRMPVQVSHIKLGILDLWGQADSVGA